MKKTFKAFLPTCLILFIAFSIMGCDKDFSILESDVIGENNTNFETPDKTIAVSAYNKKLDSVQISNLASSLLGVYHDPLYGQTTASIVAQLTPASFNPDFGIKPAIDSVVLKIPYYSKVTGTNLESGKTPYALDSIFGNPEAPFKLSIYQNKYFLRDFNPSEGFETQQRYYSNANNADKTINSALTETSVIDFDSQKGALIFTDNNLVPSNKQIRLTYTDSTKTPEFLEPSLRLKLDTTIWHTEIIKKQGTNVLSNTNNFLNHFRGLYLKVEPIANDGSMVLLNLASSDANVVIYYSKDVSATDATRTQGTYTLNFTANKLNTFVNDLNLVTLSNGNKATGDQKLYLKNAASMAIVDLFGNEDLDKNGVPDQLEALREEFKDGEYQDRLINEAQLIFYEDITSPESTHEYDRIYAYDVNNNAPLIDYTFDETTNTNNPISSKFFHLGTRIEQETGVWKYKIRITEHLNNLIFKDSTNTKIGLVLSNNVNYTNNALILNSNDGVTSIPAASVISPRGTILSGSNEAVNADRRMLLKLFFTKSK
ncbi:DUF4270 domain-containing protein [Mariniflexile ostreae]|uniref:DUF4270 domain-containing protein n=1 Tax=Mariniflexile ostreae TaxID=1520892 RepID=A0ABV5F7H9_9FLAO